MVIYSGVKGKRPDIETLKTIHSVLCEIDDFDNPKEMIENLTSLLHTAIVIIESEIEDDNK